MEELTAEFGHEASSKEPLAGDRFWASLGHLAALQGVRTRSWTPARFPSPKPSRQAIRLAV